LVVGHRTVARVAEALAVSWNTANDGVAAGSHPGLRYESVVIPGCGHIDAATPGFLAGLRSVFAS
jgi:hypothetical protein